MSFIEGIKTNYVAPKPSPNTWRNRFKVVEDWATSAPWEIEEKPTEAEIKKCVETLFEAVNDACAGFRWIGQKEGSTVAESLANILEGR